MRILVFNWKDIRNPEAGGAEVFTHESAKRWVEWGHDVMLFCRRFPGAAEREEVDGVRVERRGGRFRVYREARRWYREEGRGRFDVVVDEVNTRPFSTPSFVKDAPIVALIYQLAREVWFHESPRPVAVAGRYLLEPAWLRPYRAVPTLTVSESTRKDLEALGFRRVSVVPVGLSLPGVLPLLPKEPVPTMLFVGRLARNKRPDNALAALRLLRRSLPEARLWVVGDGYLRDGLRRNAPDGVRFFGNVSQHEKFTLMSRAHVLVAPSVREGWGLSVTEAAAVGTPAVGYDVPGLRDSIRHNRTGVLVPASPAALAEACLRVLREPGLAEALGAEAREVARSLSWEATAEAVLNRVMGAASSPADRTVSA